MTELIYAHITTDYRYASNGTGPLLCEQHILNCHEESPKVNKVYNSGMHLNYKILISNSYFTANQNGSKRQTDEKSVLAKVFHTI
jgi:hypothetical protein